VATTAAASCASTATDAAGAWASLGGRPAVAEQALDLELELSVMVARRASGETVVYPPAVNHHERQILAWSTLPGDVDPRVARDARELARGIAEELALEGLLAVEMFLLRDGRLLVNELAPRPHNSYHASELAMSHESVRATRARRVRPPARRAGAGPSRGDREPARRSLGRRPHAGLRGGARGAGHTAVSLRQARRAPRPQDGTSSPPWATRPPTPFRACSAPRSCCRREP
jgi:hypothetical protein